MTPPTAVTIGNFDGVHLGHVKLVEAARAAVDATAGGTRGRVVAFAFDPHPLSVLRPELAPPRLTSFSRRRDLLMQAGADEVVVIEPTRQFLSQTAEDFITSLVESHRPAAIVEGPDFRFGRGRAGTVDTLRELGKSHGYGTIIIDPVKAALSDHSLVTASSSMIRWLLQRGRVSDASRLLGRPHELHGSVVKGDQRGREIGVPTINLDHGDLMLPKDGVYAGWAARGEGQPYPAAISVGTKPTFGASPRVCEAHLLDYDGPLDEYGWEVRLSFDRWLRDQLAYAEVGLLKQQMSRDIARVRQYCESQVTSCR